MLFRASVEYEDSPGQTVLVYSDQQATQRYRVARFKLRLGPCPTSWDYSSFPASGHVPRVGSSRSRDLGKCDICMRQSVRT